MFIFVVVLENRLLLNEKIKLFIALFLFLILFQFFVWIQNPNEIIVSFMKYYSCFIYVVCVIISFCFKTRVVFPYILYLFTFGVFMMSRIFLDAFEVENAFLMLQRGLMIGLFFFAYQI